MAECRSWGFGEPVWEGPGSMAGVEAEGGGLCRGQGSRPGDPPHSLLGVAGGGTPLLLSPPGSAGCPGGPGQVTHHLPAPRPSSALI